jgi:hypothetical protein
MIYMLRLPVKLGLDGFFKELVVVLERSLGRPLSLELQGAVAQDLKKHLTAFDTCGASSYCDEATVPAKWNQGYDPALLSSDPRLQDSVVRVHLNLPQDSLDVFSGGLARFIDSHLENSDSSRRDEAARAVSAFISPYLFHGEICRRNDHCTHAAAKPIEFKIGEAA